MRSFILIASLLFSVVISSAQLLLEESILGPVVDSDILKIAMTDPDFLSQIKILEASLNKSTELDYKNGHIANAIYFDAAQNSNQSDLIIYDIPNQDSFEKYVSSLGISNDDDILIYDRTKHGLNASARACFLFKLFGHDYLSILNGGLRNYLSKGYNLSSRILNYPKTKFQAFYRPELAKTFKEMLGIVKAKNMTIIDAREISEFNQGHIPNAINVPFSSLFDPKSNLLKSELELWNLMNLKNVDLRKPIVTYCFKNPRGSALMFVLDSLGAENVSLYVGSWNEWSKRIKESD